MALSTQWQTEPIRDRLNLHHNILTTFFTIGITEPRLIVLLRSVVEVFLDRRIFRRINPHCR